VFTEGVDGSQYENFLFSPCWNDEFTKVTSIQLEYEKNWEASPPVMIYGDTFLNKEDVGRLIAYLQEQLEKM
jgi:hypothetical protein